MSCARGCCETQREHYRSLSFYGKAAAPVDATESQWSKDMRAYKNLRANGLQPRQIDGAARLEQGAETPLEVESGQTLTVKQRKQVETITNAIG